jgi:hypothetical protein
MRTAGSRRSLCRPDEQSIRCERHNFRFKVEPYCLEPKLCIGVQMPTAAYVRYVGATRVPRWPLDTVDQQRPDRFWRSFDLNRILREHPRRRGQCPFGQVMCGSGICAVCVMEWSPMSLAGEWCCGLRTGFPNPRSLTERAFRPCRPLSRPRKTLSHPLNNR